MAARLPNHSERVCIDRRSLLKTSVAITAAKLAPTLSLSETVPVVSVQSVSTTSDALLNIGAATARRLAVIERGNTLRHDAGSALLKVAKKVRRMEEAEDS
jgi:hypothetical protein